MKKKYTIRIIDEATQEVEAENPADAFRQFEDEVEPEEWLEEYGNGIGYIMQGPDGKEIDMEELFE